MGFKHTYAYGTATITSGNTSKVITHGLSFIPSAGDISVMPTVNSTADCGTIWVDTINISTFTVHCANNPGASGLNFGWSAYVPDNQ